MLQHCAGDTHTEVAHLGEVREALLAGRMVLAKDHFPVRAVFGAPVPDASLQCTAQPMPVAVGMASLHLLQQRHRPQTGAIGEQRQDLALPEASQGVRALSWRYALSAFLRRQLGVAFKAASGALAEAAAGGGDALSVMTAIFHARCTC